MGCPGDGILVVIRILCRVQVVRWAAQGKGVDGSVCFLHERAEPLPGMLVIIERTGTAWGKREVGFPSAYLLSCE